MSSAAWRWEFRRYDYRRQNFGRGWLQYVGLGPVLLVVGFHRNRLYRKRGRYWRSSRPFAWIELTLYGPGLGVGKSVYPKVRIPETWL